MDNKPVFRGKVGTIEKVAFVCNSFLLIVFLYDQLFAQLNLLLLIFFLALIELYLIFFGLFPEEYCFSTDSLEIHRKFRKTVIITYNSVFNMDSVVKDKFINITQSSSVKLYYEDEKKKKTIICRPFDAVRFVEMVKERCEEFKEEPRKTDIDKLIGS